jgi:hypothetical protein
MTDAEFDYQAILQDDKETVTSLIAYQAPAHEKLRAVLWHATRKAWIYAPAIASELLFDSEEQQWTKPVDRPTAETIARQSLGTTLPSEAVLAAMSAEGELMGWDYGPPKA